MAVGQDRRTLQFKVGLVLHSLWLRPNHGQAVLIIFADPFSDHIWPWNFVVGIPIDCYYIHHVVDLILRFWFLHQYLLPRAWHSFDSRLIFIGWRTLCLFSFITVMLGSIFEVSHLHMVLKFIDSHECYKLVWLRRICCYFEGFVFILPKNSSRRTIVFPLCWALLPLHQFFILRANSSSAEQVYMLMRLNLPIFQHSLDLSFAIIGVPLICQIMRFL